MAAKIYYMATPHENEKEAIQHIANRAPEGSIVIYGMLYQKKRSTHQPVSGQGDLEVDITLVSPQGVYNLELKNWAGQIRDTLQVGRRSVKVVWPSGRTDTEPNPVDQASRQSRPIRGLITPFVPPRLRNTNLVEPIVVFTGKPNSLQYKVDPECEVRVLELRQTDELYQREESISIEEIQSLARGLKLEETYANHVVGSRVGDIVLSRHIIDRYHYRLFLGEEQETGRKLFVKLQRIDPGQKNKLQADWEEINRRDPKCQLKLEDSPYVSLYVSKFWSGSFEICSLTKAIDGNSLYEILRGKMKVTLEDKLAILRSIVAGVDHIHQQGIYHRDLHPVNIWATANWKVKFINFDFSRVVGDKTVLGGLPNPDSLYAAPELSLGQRHLVDYHTDYYSVGFIMYELLTGKRPFEVYSRPQKSLADFGLGLPQDMSDAVNQLLLIDKDERELGWQVLRDLLAQDRSR